MANSKYAYVRTFELPDNLLPGTYMLFRLDGHSFHRFSEKHNFTKPNDVRALELMDRAAIHLMDEFPDIRMAFGESDEYSFLLHPSTALYNRREAKIVSTLTSLFTSAYVYHWPTYFPQTKLEYPPSFDGRMVLYPTEQTVRDYFAWRQADTHINNLYNTTFWALVQQGGKTTTEAHAILKGTFSKDKNEILFTQFGINYNTIDQRFRKGSVLYREFFPLPLEEVPASSSSILSTTGFADDKDPRLGTLVGAESRGFGREQQQEKEQQEQGEVLSPDAEDQPGTAKTIVTTATTDADADGDADEGRARNAFAGDVGTLAGTIGTVGTIAPPSPAAAAAVLLDDAGAVPTAAVKLEGEREDRAGGGGGEGGNPGRSTTTAIDSSIITPPVPSLSSLSSVSPASPSSSSIPSAAVPPVPAAAAAHDQNPKEEGKKTVNLPAEINTNDTAKNQTHTVDEAKKDQTKKDKKDKKEKKEKAKDKQPPPPPPSRVVVAHIDIIKDDFWNQRPEILKD